VADTHAEIDAAMARLGFHAIVSHGPLWSGDAVLVSAAALGVSVSDDYVHFATVHGPGAFDVRTVVDLAASTPIGSSFAVDILYAPGSRPDWDPFHLLEATYDGQLPARMLPIGTDPGGDLLLLDREGRVLAWDHEHRELSDDALDAMARDLRATGVEVESYDVGQLILMWEDAHRERVPSPTGHGNLYAVAASFAEFCSSLRAA
jgi:hypothetical protein